MPKNRVAIAIRNATKKDLAAVEKWLRAEREQRGESFFCNWSIIANACKRKELIVLAADGDIVGFVVDAPSGPDIVAVRPDKRGMGYGRRLAEWAITSAIDRGNSVIEGECAPESSVPFWKKMGFTVSQNRRESRGGPYAYKVLERKIALSEGPRVPFEIAFYPEKRDWNKNIKPFRMYAGEAQLLKDGSLQLPERAICFLPEIRDFDDCVVRVAVNGTRQFENKVKHPEANYIGVHRDVGGIYFLDKIYRSDTR